MARRRHQEDRAGRRRAAGLASGARGRDDSVPASCGRESRDGQGFFACCHPFGRAALWRGRPLPEPSLCVPRSRVVCHFESERRCGPSEAPHAAPTRPPEPGHAVRRPSLGHGWREGKKRPRHRRETGRRGIDGWAVRPWRQRGATATGRIEAVPRGEVSIRAGIPDLGPRAPARGAVSGLREDT